LRERSNDFGILIVLRTVLRSSVSGFDKRIAYDRKDCRPVLRHCLSGFCLILGWFRVFFGLSKTVWWLTVSLLSPLMPALVASIVDCGHSAFLGRAG
jgi:hypothetical protein